MFILIFFSADIESDVQDGSSKLANSDGNQNELKANEDVKAIETGIILLIHHCPVYVISKAI